jgi:hypothetical protein
MHFRRSAMCCRYSASPPKEISVQSRVQVRSPPDIRLAAPPRRCARLGWLRHLVQLLRRCGRVSRCRHIAPQLSMQRWSLPDQFHSLLSPRSVLSVQLLSSERNLGSIEGASARALRLRLAASPRRCARLSRLRHLAGALALPAAGWLLCLAQLLRKCSRVSRCRHIAPQLSVQRSCRLRTCPPSGKADSSGYRLARRPSLRAGRCARHRDRLGQGRARLVAWAPPRSASPVSFAIQPPSAVDAPTRPPPSRS